MTPSRAGDGRPLATSESHPIRVDAIPVDFVSGRLGITFAPGKKDAGGAAPWRDFLWDRDLDADLEQLRERWGTDVVVSLMQRHEHDEVEIRGFYDAVARHGMRSVAFEIVDGSVPDDHDRDAFDRMIDGLYADLEAGRNVVIHCKGGLGRSGMVAACVLVRSGLAPDEAIDVVREHRPGSIQTFAQEEYVYEFAARAPG
jgi:protein-tyrosine phosphatase